MSDATSMFADIPILAPADEHTGSALLCFLSQDTFVGFVELEQHDSERRVIKLTGSESLTGAHVDRDARDVPPHARVRLSDRSCARSRCAVVRQSATRGCARCKTAVATRRSW